MKKLILFIAAVFSTGLSMAQVDSSLLRRRPSDTTGMLLNMDAAYNRPFLNVYKTPVALGGYIEGNWQHLGTDGVTEGHQFQMRRVTLFVASSIARRIRFLSEIEFEDGTKEINIEFAALDLEMHPLLNLRGGIIMNPIGSFNQNHDGPKWEFVDRPVSATQLLPATWSNVGFGIYGKQYKDNWVYAYEAYVTNGFNDRIIDNSQGRTSLPAAKEDRDRFEESFNGSPMITAKAAIKHKKIAEVGLSYMSGIYNKFEDDGLILDKKRAVNIYAIDANTTLLRIRTYINAEWVWVRADVPQVYTQQYGQRQTGGFADIVQPVFSGNVFGFKTSVINLACRLEYVDWNVGKFNETGTNIADDFWGITPGISWRPIAQTVFRANYKIALQRDLLGNPPSQTAGLQVGLSSYF